MTHLLTNENMMSHWASMRSRCLQLRSAQHPDGLPVLGEEERNIVETANTITANTMEMATTLCEAGVAVSIENPQSSLSHGSH